nr:TonB-dependent receptor [Xanthomonas citri]
MGRALLLGHEGLRFGTGRQRNYRHVAATAFNDMQVSYQLPWNATVRLGLNNVFDRDPPVALSASANSFDSAYAIPGRYSYLQYTQRF